MPHSFVPGWRRQVARRMRHEPTKAEKALWRIVKEMRRQGVAHFRRQVPIGPFIVDFVEFGVRLIVEANGGQHGGSRDDRRDEFLRTQDFHVLRLWNSDILSNPEGTWLTLVDALDARRTPTLTLPARGRELAPGPDTCASPPPCGEGMGVGVCHTRNSSRET